MPRERKAGEGQFIRLKSGRVRYRVMRGYKPDGRPNMLEFRGATEAECRQAYLDYQFEERQHGVAADAKKRTATLGDFAPVFLAALDDEVTRGKIEPRTRGFYAENLARYLLPALRAKQLRAIGADDLDRLYTVHAHQPRTAQAIHQTARRLFKLAKRYRWTTYVPTADTEKPEYKAPERTPPSGASVRRLLDAAEREGPTVAAILALASMGLRPGEVMGIDRPALHLDAGQVDVLVARETRGAPGTKPVKSEKARRRVPLTKRTVALLRAHLEQETVRRLTGPLFCTRTGTPLRWRNVYRSWPDVRDAAGLPEDTRPYDLRHAFVTELLAEGVPLHEVSWLAGHASTHFTADRYGHRVARRDTAARSALEHALGEDD